MSKRLDADKVAEAALKKGERTPRRSKSLSPPPPNSKKMDAIETGKETNNDRKIEGKEQGKVCSGEISKGQVCAKPVVEDVMGSIKCDICMEWFHVKCEGLNIKAAGMIRDMHLIWMCQGCVKFIPEFRSVVKGERQVADMDMTAEIVRVGKKIQDLEESLREGVRTAKMESDSKYLKMEESLGKVLIKVEKAVKQNVEIFNSAKDTMAEDRTSYADILKQAMSEKADEMSNRVSPLATAHEPDITQVQECLDRESRKCNVVISNLPEAVGTGIMNRVASDKQAVYEMFHELNIEVDIGKTVRLGAKSRDGKPRLLLVSTSTEETKWDIIRSGKGLRDIYRFRNVYVNPDMTRTERQVQGKLRAEVRERKEKGEDVYIYKGKIILRKNGRCTVNGGGTKSGTAHQDQQQESASAVSRDTEERPDQQQPISAEPLQNENPAGKQ